MIENIMKENKMEKSRFKNGIIYVFIANAISLFIGLFTGFFLPKLLSIETYANIKLFQLYITYVGILHLGFADGMYLRLGGKKIDELNNKEILTEFKTFKLFQLIVNISALVICIILKKEVLFFCALSILPINISSYIRNLFNAVGLFKKYSRYTNINTIFIFAVNIFLLLIIKTDNYKLYLTAYVIAYIAYWLFIEYENRKLFGVKKTKFEKKYLIEDIKSGFLLMIGNFCNVIFTSRDRLFVKNLLGTIKFAFYSFAVSVENLMTVFITPISTVMYNYLCTHKEKKQILNVKKYILIFAAAVIIVVFPVKFIVNTWITKYEESLSVLFLLFAAQYISIMIRCVHINLYKAEKKQNRYFFIMISIVIFSIISNAIGYIIFKNMIAIAVATLITNTLWFIIGELDFKMYRLNIRDYIYIFVVMIVFLLCACIPNAIIGFVTYFVSTLVLSITLQKKVLYGAIKMAFNFVKNKIK